MKGPWYITEEQAAARELEAARQLQADMDRCIVSEMPNDAKRMKLAARRWSSDELRRLLPIVKRERSHGA